MNKLRIVRENLVKTAATLTADTEAGSLVVENMQDDRKSVIWRSTAKTATITVTWSLSQFVNCVILPFCSLKSEATMRVRLYSTGDVLEYDSTATICCAYSTFEVFNWGSEPLGVNAYTVGGGTYARVYCDETQYNNGNIVKVVIDLDDDNASQANSYLESGCLVIGEYYEFNYNPNYGANIKAKFSDKEERSQAGDLITIQGNLTKSLNFNLGWINAQGRDQVANMFKQSTTPIFISMFPEDSDITREQDGQIYGKIQSSGYNHSFYNNYATTIPVKEI